MMMMMMSCSFSRRVRSPLADAILKMRAFNLKTSSFSSFGSGARACQPVTVSLNDIYYMAPIVRTL